MTKGSRGAQRTRERAQWARHHQRESTLAIIPRTHRTIGHETSKVRCLKALRGRDPPNTKRHTEKQRKAHHTMKYTQECPWAPSVHKVCPCRHTPCEPPQAQQGINKKRYPPPNKPPPRAPRRRPTTHVCFVCSLYSQPPARKEAGCEGQPHVTERREPHATGERTTATKHTCHRPKGTRRARGMPARARVRYTPQAPKGMDV